MIFWMIVIAVVAFIAGFLTASQVWQYWARRLDEDNRNREIRSRAGRPGLAGGFKSTCCGSEPDGGSGDWPKLIAREQSGK